MNLHTQRRVLLALEELESRWVPATIHFVNGTLSITNLVSVAPAVLNVQQTAIPNTFQVWDGTGSSTLTFTGVSNVLVDSGNANHNVLFNTNGAVYTGSLTINAHNGNDSINVTNNAVGSGILGNTTVLTATGNDSVSIGDSGNGQMIFGGNVVVAKGSGTDLVQIGKSFTSIRGSLSITGGDSITLSSVLAQGGTSLQDGGIGTSSMTIVGPAIFGKYLNITGGASGSDFLTIDDAPFIVVNGNTNITLGAGNDTFIVDVDTTFNGNFNYVELGSGSDSVNVMSPLVGTTKFNGNASFNLGNGTDTFTLAAGTTTISGNLSIQAGSGNDNITTGAAVFGNLSMQLGNGNDTIVVNSTAAPFGIFSLSAGNGNSSVSLTPGAATAFNIAFNFGTGTNTLTLGGTASTISGSLLSQNPGGNVFDNSGGWTISSPWTSNF